MMDMSDMATEFYDGEWHLPSAPSREPLAVVTFSDEPSPETGGDGWCWWALGKMGDAPTYEAARRKAETWVRARQNGLPASGRCA